MHSNCYTASCGFAAFDAARTLLSLREATVLAEVSENRIRKDIETGVLKAPFVTRINDSRLCTHWSYVFTLAAVYGNKYMPGALRKRVLHEIRWIHDSPYLSEVFLRESRKIVTHDHNWRLNLGKFSEEFLISVDTYVKIDYAKVVNAIHPRIELYVSGLGRVDERDDILGGEAVFRSTRVPVVHVGRMAEKGESVTNILEDFHSLSVEDVEFAKLYYRAHPPVGRPRVGAEDRGNDAPAAA